MRPRVILFNAVSLDGYTTGFAPDQSAFYEIAGSIKEDVTLAGCDTLLAATPHESAAPPVEVKQATKNPNAPILAVTDSAGRLKQWAYWQTLPIWRSHIALCTDETPQDHIADIEKLGVRVWRSNNEGSDNRQVDLNAALTMLAKEYGAKTVRLESGGRLNAAFMRAGLIDEIYLLIHPVIVGAPQATVFLTHLNRQGPLRLDLAFNQRVAEELVLLKYVVTSSSSAAA